MKIAFVYDVIYPYVKGGVEKRVWELATRLTRRGHDVHLFGMKFWDGEDILIREGVFLHGVCPAQKLYVGGRRTIWQAFYFSIHLISPLLKERFDIIDCQQFPYFSCFSAKFFSKLKKIPLVITWHEVWGDYWYEYLGWKGFVGKTIERLVARLTSENVAVSKTTAKNLKNLGLQHDIIIIPNGIDLTRIRSISPSSEPWDIIFVGRLIKEKHADLLINAVELLQHEFPDIRVLIIGEGPEWVKSKNLIDDKKINQTIYMCGFYRDHDDFIAHLKSSKVFVLPSTREGFGISALEALACGLPVVTVDHQANAVRDLITENNGFLCSLSAQDLADKISLALQHYTEMKGSCIESVVSFDWNCITSDIEAYYQSTIYAQKLPEKKDFIRFYYFLK
jgi:glycosyltransferase involved in cell wall biosynthesis